MAKKVAEQEQFINALMGVVEEASNSERVSGTIASMATEDPERYGLLTEGEIQAKFVGWMNSPDNPIPYRSVDPTQMTPALLRQAWLGFIDDNQDLVTAAVPEAVKSPRSTGGGTGTTMRRVKPAATALDDFERAFNEASG